MQPQQLNSLARFLIPIGDITFPEYLFPPLGVPHDARAFAVNWTPAGDEVELTFIQHNTIINQIGLADSGAWFHLTDLNPGLTQYNLGYSDLEPEFAILGLNCCCWNWAFYLIRVEDIYPLFTGLLATNRR